MCWIYTSTEQRTIDEQISALQGTLVLTRIIQQQKQNYRQI